MRYYLLVAIWLFSAGQSSAGDISTGDFAVGYQLEVEEKGAVYSLELPEEVYKTVQNSDLRDIGVFNGNEEIVPHELRNVAVEQTTLSEKETIPYFPLFQEIGSKDPAGFLLQVSRNTAGTIVNIQPDSTNASGDRKITGYLIDLSRTKNLSELEFHWHKNLDSSVFTVNIEQSDDLVHWKPLVQKATLADLRFGGQQVEKRTIELSPTTLQYLRLTWQETDWRFGLTEIYGLTKVGEPRVQQRWTSLGNGQVQMNDERMTITFATSFHFPTGSVQIRFPETNSIARLSVQSRSGADGGWKTRCNQVFYDLRIQDTVVRNESCDFPPTADPQWRVVVEQDGAGLRSGRNNLSLQLGWQPSELLFIGRGTPPYLLAFGSGKLAHTETHHDNGMILQAIRMNSSTQVVRPVKLGKRVRLGGESALQSPAAPLPWAKILLWTVLLLGVGLLAFMVRCLTKEMKAAEEKKVSDEK